MLEADFQEYSQNFKGPHFRNPPALAERPFPVRRLLIIGSCLAGAIREHCRCPSDFILFNGGVMPPLPQDPASYDFQIVQIPLRIVMRDDDLWHLSYHQIDAFEQALAAATERLQMFFDQFLQYHQRTGLPAFVLNFMVPTQNPNGKLFSFFDVRNVQFFILRLNMALEQLCQKRALCHVLDVDNIANTHGKRFFSDESLNWYAHGATTPVITDGADGSRIEATPHTHEHYELFHQGLFFEAIIAEAVASYKILRQVEPIKMIVVDLDDTLWKGVSGEKENAERIMTAIWPEPLVPMSEGWPLGVAEALLYCKRRGLLLGIISKGDESHVRKMLPQIYDGKLSLDEFGIHRISWEPKSANMRCILETVNLLPESVLFIDDSPAERQLMQAAYPAMKIIGKYFQYTRHLLLFSAETQVPAISAESGRRTDMIQRQAVRETKRKEMSEAEFLASLQVDVHFYEINDPADPKCHRAVELINKTNQWNSTGERTDLHDIASRLRAGQRLFGFAVKDQFVAYGDVGFLFVRQNRILQFVMSCRVVGLLVEMCVFRQVMEHLGCNELRMEFRKTPRNQPLQTYLAAKFALCDGGYVISGDALAATPNSVSSSGHR